MAVAFVGAGGKSTALARLAAELPPEIPALLTTTTRLAAEQRTIAAVHRVLASPASPAEIADELLRAGSLLVTGPLSEDGRKWTAPGPEQMAELHIAAKQAGAALLIEADGARNRSLKAPAVYEPVIPSFVDLVAPMVGLDVLGQRLDEIYVHRPEIVAAVLAVEAGVELEPEHLIGVLTHPLGALKDVPPLARVRLILNKADGVNREQIAEKIAEQVLEEGRIQSVVIATLASDPAVRLRVERVGGAVLAAGGSSRLGQPKQLIHWRGTPLVGHAVAAALGGGLQPVVVVVGAQAAEVQRAIGDLAVEFVENPAWQAGQSTSLRAGLAALSERVEALIFLLADMPNIDPPLIRALVARQRRSAARIIAPRAGGRWANPVLFDVETFAALAEVRGDQGGRAIFDQFDIEALAWDPKILLDVDTPEDLRGLDGQG